MIVFSTPGLTACNGVHAYGSGAVRNRVLLAENVLRPRQKISLRLRQSGYIVHEAADAATTLAILGRQEVDIVLLSLELPDRGGLDLLGEVVRVAHGVPVIVCTFSYNVHYGVDVMKCGARDYLTKPLDEKKVLEAVTAVLKPVPPLTPVFDTDPFARQVHLQRRADNGELALRAIQDLGNPLFVVYGMAQLLADMIEPAHPRYAHVLQLQAAAQEAARRFENIKSLEMSGVRRGDLNAVVERMRPLFEAAFRNEFELLVDTDETLGYAAADPAQIQQALVSFVRNARAAVPQGGQIVIRTANADLAEERNGVPPGSYTVLSVRDNGCGMSVEVLTRIYEPYFGTRPPRDAAGLGLTIAAAIIHTVGGYIVCDSRPGQGTEVSVYFPRVDADQIVVAGDTGGEPGPNRLNSPDNHSNGGTISNSVQT